MNRVKFLLPWQISGKYLFIKNFNGTMIASIEQHNGTYFAVSGYYPMKQHTFSTEEKCKNYVESVLISFGFKIITEKMLSLI